MHRPARSSRTKAGWTEPQQQQAWPTVGWSWQARSAEQDAADRVDRWVLGHVSGVVYDIPHATAADTHRQAADTHRQAADMARQRLLEGIRRIVLSLLFLQPFVVVTAVAIIIGSDANAT